MSRFRRSTLVLDEYTNGKEAQQYDDACRCAMRMGSIGAEKLMVPGCTSQTSKRKTSNCPHVSTMPPYDFFICFSTFPNPLARQSPPPPRPVLTTRTLPFLVSRPSIRNTSCSSQHRVAELPPAVSPLRAVHAGLHGGGGVCHDLPGRYGIQELFLSRLVAASIDGRRESSRVSSSLLLSKYHVSSRSVV